MKEIEKMAEVIENTFMSKDFEFDGDCRCCEHLVEPQGRTPLSDCDRICKKYKEEIVYYDGFNKCWQCVVGSKEFYTPIATALHNAGYRKQSDTVKEFAEKVNRKAEIECDSDFNISIYNLEALTETIAETEIEKEKSNG